MSNDNQDDIITPENNDEPMESDLDLSEETPAEEKPAKTAETPEARLARLERMVSQQKKKLGTPEVKPDTKSPSSEFGYAEKAFLTANGIKGDEVALAKAFMANTGKSLDDVVENKYFLQELKDFRAALETKQAVPTGTKRSSTPASTTADYWYSKYTNGTPASEIPQEFRSEVFNKRASNEKSANPFAGR